MKQILRLLALAALCVPALSQVNVTPVVQPHQTFVDGSGSPCALCSLYTYVAGTTTPLATYTDSTGTSQNPNPIVLDVAGGANIWVGTTATYKFVLRNALGATVWTVDNVKSSGGGALPCTSAYAVQFANSTMSALACDPAITINPSSHALQVGGAISGPAFTLRNLSAITNSWTLDVTSPTTAAGSLAPFPLLDLAPQAADSTVMNATGASAAPTAVLMPTGCTQGVTYNTAVHAWSCTGTNIPLANLATQGADTVVMNATGSGAVPTAVALPSACPYAIGYNTATHTWSCAGSAPTQTIFKSAGNTPSGAESRDFGIAYQNTGTTLLWVKVSIFCQAAACGISGSTGPTAGAMQLVDSASFPYNGGAGQESVNIPVLPGSYYEATDSGGSSGVYNWSETTVP